MIKIHYQDVPQDANEDHTAQGSAQPFWNGSLVSSEGETVTATLEPGGWPLNGSRRLTEDGKELGFWSRVLSGENGEFEQPVELELFFGKSYTASGISLTFDRTGETYPKFFTVSWFRDGLRLADEKVYPEEGFVTVNRIVEAFDHIRLAFHRMNRPQRFLRIRRLVIGLETDFGPDELREVRLFQETDILSTRLSGNTLNFTLSEQKGRFLRFQNRQPMEIWKDDTLLGRFYLKDSSKTERNGYQISCVDAVGILADSPCMGGIYQNVPFRQLVEKILAGQFTAEVHPSFAEERLSGWLPAGSKRDALLQAAFAVGAMVSTVGGRLQFLPVPQYSERVERGREIFAGGSVVEKPPITSVTVTAHDYTPGTVRETMLDRTVEAGNMVLRMDKPCSGYQVQGGSILDSGANYLNLNADGGPLVITAIPYREHCVSRTWNNPKVTAADGENPLEIGKATLVNQSRVNAVLKRVQEYAENRQELRQKIVYQGQEPGELITSVKPFDGQLVGYITEMDLSLVGKGVAEVTVIGRNVELESVDAGFSGSVESGVI